MKEYPNARFWMANMHPEKLGSILLRDAYDEDEFTKNCIRIAIKNQKALTGKMSRAEIETAEALEEDLL